MEDDEADTRAFWDLMQRTTGARSASWDTFSATFETYLRRYYAAEMSQLPRATRAEAEMVLRYAFDRGSPARAAAGERVAPKHLALFLTRFGPMRSCLIKAARSLFDESGCLVPWFHGKLSRDEARRAIEEWEASRGNGREQRGVFLFRYSDWHSTICFSFRRKRGERRLVTCLINNEGRRGYTLPDTSGDGCWRDLREFVAEQRRGDFLHPVPSALHRECVEEIEARRRAEQFVPTPENQIAYARQLFGEAQTMVYSRDMKAGFEATRILEEALGLVEKVEHILRELEQGQGDPQLQAKALRLGGDILWKLHREEEGVASYLRCLSVVSEAEKVQGASHDGSPVVTISVLSHVHQLLAEYFLSRGSPGRGLDHFSELVACTTDEDARRQLVDDFRRNDGFQRATAGLTQSSVQEILDEGISYFRCQDYGPAGVRFEKVLRDARCIGEGRMEARALGNLATVDYKTHRIPAAIRRYRRCVQLLRQQGNQVTERKILNYLVMCCIEAQRWAPAKLFHEQLSKLAESEQNVRLLGRLQERIEEGMALQARQEGDAAPASSGGGGGGGGGSGSGGGFPLQQGGTTPTGGGGGMYSPSRLQGSALDSSGSGDGHGVGSVHMPSQQGETTPTRDGSGGGSSGMYLQGGVAPASGVGGGDSDDLYLPFQPGRITPPNSGSGRGSNVYSHSRLPGASPVSGGRIGGRGAYSMHQRGSTPPSSGSGGGGGGGGGGGYLPSQQGATTWTSAGNSGRGGVCLPSRIPGAAPTSSGSGEASGVDVSHLPLQQVRITSPSASNSGGSGMHLPSPLQGAPASDGSGDASGVDGLYSTPRHHVAALGSGGGGGVGLHAYTQQAPMTGGSGVGFPGQQWGAPPARRGGHDGFYMLPQQPGAAPEGTHRIGDGELCVRPQQHGAMREGVHGGVYIPRQPQGAAPEGVRGGGSRAGGVCISPEREGRASPVGRRGDGHRGGGGGAGAGVGGVRDGYVMVSPDRPPPVPQPHYGPYSSR